MENQKKLIIYHHYLFEAGGCETFVYNFCSLLRNWYNIIEHGKNGYLVPLDMKFIIYHIILTI